MHYVQNWVTLYVVSCLSRQTKFIMFYNYYYNHHTRSGKLIKAIKIND